MTAVVAVIAILLAVFLIAWARVEIHGTQDLQALIDDEAVAHTNGSPENEAASSRWATGFSH